ncbi:PepSY domain-containing protein, partial [Paracoccus sp. Z118]|uniref:PepSY-associated TM helix domain-containing protein n=1 Tax=Paracoccus sp. Z118 TaxID=2851017 RepID=UPI001C2CB2A7
AAVIDPATGLDAASADPDVVRRWLTNLHRSLFLGDAGRIVAAVGAGAMLLLALSGATLVARRVGGWRRWFAPLRGSLTGRLHVEVARIAVVGLVLSTATALWMSASTFDLLPDAARNPVFPTETSGQTGASLEVASALQLPAASLRSLSLADPTDPTDV